MPKGILSLFRNILMSTGTLCSLSFYIKMMSCLCLKHKQLFLFSKRRKRGNFMKKLNKKVVIVTGGMRL